MRDDIRRSWPQNEVTVVDPGTRHARSRDMSGGRADVSRCLGVVTGAARGPTVVIVGGIHGNEPAGVLGAKAVMSELRSMGDVLRGRVIAFTGNRRALTDGRRYVARDLNREWRTAHLDELRAQPAPIAEDREQRELGDAIVALEREGGRLFFLDLHTTSGPTEPFACFEDTSENRSVACSLPVNVVLGLERSLHGTLLSWVEGRGHVGVSFEAGQHADPLAPRRHEAAIWMFLVACGVLDAPHVQNEAEHLAIFAGASACPKVVEVRHRHVVEDGDDFVMLEGFGGFDPVEAGQVVALDRRGPIRSPESGLMLMPRYQAQGEDGFFVAREILANGGPRGLRDRT